MDDKTQTNEIEEVMAPKISHFIIEDETPVDNFKWENDILPYVEPFSNKFWLCLIP